MSLFGEGNTIPAIAMETRIAAARAEERKRVWLEAAKMAEEEAKKTQAEAPHWPLWGDPDRDFASALADRLRAKAEKE